MSPRHVVRLAVTLALILPGVVQAQGGSGTSPVIVCVGHVQGCLHNGTDSTFTVVGSAGSGPRDGNAPSAGGQAVVLPATYEVVQYTPTCSGNTRSSGEVLCGAAVFSCQPPGGGLVRYWEWVVTVDRATGAERGVVQRPGTFCVRPAQVGLPLVAAIGGVVAAEFQRLRVTVGVVRSEPGPRTLVNLETGFWTDARGPYGLSAVRVLGHRVVVTATPVSYEWLFGDGSSLRTEGPGASGTLQVSHTYRETGVLGARVVVTWSGSYTVDGGAPRAVVGTARTTGPVTRLQVVQARAELVSR
jgi:hypothetical protein